MTRECEVSAGKSVVKVFRGLDATIGIPKDSIVKYESALKADKFILLAHGTAAEVANAKDIVQTTNPTELALHGTER
jgi:hypothetical protein